jgi:hypothetical protein
MNAFVQLCVRGEVWCSMVWCDMVWYCVVWYGMVWYGMVWYGMVWYGMVWYGMVWYMCMVYGCVGLGIVQYAYSLTHLSKSMVVIISEPKTSLQVSETFFIIVP